VNPNVSQDISSSELRSIKSFCKNALGIFSHRLRKTWDRLVFTGTGQAPIEVNSIEEMRSKVMNTPGAIGYAPLQNKDQKNEE